MSDKISFDTLTAVTQVGGVYGTTVSYGSVNVKGAWTQLSASTPHAATAIVVNVAEQGGGYEDHLMDIATGAAASEVVLIPNLAIAGRGAYGGSWLIPVTIPSGTRLSVRGQRSTGNNPLRCSIILINGVLPTSTAVESLGADLTGSQGTAVDPGGVADTKGSWVQLIASTANDIHWLVVMCNTDADNATSQHWSVDIGTGGAGAEVVVAPDIFTALGASQGLIEPRVTLIPVVTIPSGTRVAARAQSSNIASPSRLINVYVLGINRVEPAGGGGLARIIGG